MVLQYLGQYLVACRLVGIARLVFVLARIEHLSVIVLGASELGRISNLFSFLYIFVSCAYFRNYIPIFYFYYCIQ